MAGNHGAHNSYQKDNYLYCETCQVKFRTGVSEADAERTLKRIKANKEVNMYILTDEPKHSGTLLAGAFDAIDQVCGTEEFSKEQAIEAIITVTGESQSFAESQFRALVDGGYISEV